MDMEKKFSDAIDAFRTHSGRISGKIGNRPEPRMLEKAVAGLGADGSGIGPVAAAVKSFYVSGTDDVSGVFRAAELDVRTCSVLVDTWAGVALSGIPGGHAVFRNMRSLVGSLEKRDVPVTAMLADLSACAASRDMSAFDRRLDLLSRETYIALDPAADRAVRRLARMSRALAGAMKGGRP